MDERGNGAGRLDGGKVGTLTYKEINYLRLVKVRKGKYLTR